MKINDVECFRTMDVATINRLHAKTLTRILLKKGVIKWDNDSSVYTLTDEYKPRTEELTRMAEYTDKSQCKKPYMVWTEAGRQLINSIVESMTQEEIKSYWFKQY